MNLNRRWHHSVCLLSVLWFSSHAHPKILVISLLALTPLHDLRASFPLSCGRSVGFLFYSSLLFSFLSTAEAIKMLFPYYCPKFNRLLWQQQQQHHSTWYPRLKMWQTDWLTNWLTGRRMCDNILGGEWGATLYVMRAWHRQRNTHFYGIHFFEPWPRNLHHWIHCKKRLRRAHIQNKFSYMSAQLQLKLVQAL